MADEFLSQPEADCLRVQLFPAPPDTHRQPPPERVYLVAEMPCRLPPPTQYTVQCDCACK